MQMPQYMMPWAEPPPEETAASARALLTKIFDIMKLPANKALLNEGEDTEDGQTEFELI